MVHLEHIIVEPRIRRSRIDIARNNAVHQLIAVHRWIQQQRTPRQIALHFLPIRRNHQRPLRPAQQQQRHPVIRKIIATNRHRRVKRRRVRRDRPVRVPVWIGIRRIVVVTHQRSAIQSRRVSRQRKTAPNHPDRAFQIYHHNPELIHVGKRSIVARQLNVLVRVVTPRLRIRRIDHHLADADVARHRRRNRIDLSTQIRQPWRSRPPVPAEPRRPIRLTRHLIRQRKSNGESRAVLRIIPTVPRRRTHRIVPRLPRKIVRNHVRRHHRAEIHRAVRLADRRLANLREPDLINNRTRENRVLHTVVVAIKILVHRRHIPLNKENRATILETQIALPPPRRHRAARPRNRIPEGR